MLAWLVHRSSSPAAEPERAALRSPVAVGIIPARLDSTRLPEKPLQDLGGAPLVVRVLERARLASALTRVLVATDSARVADSVRAAGGEVVMTRSEHSSGLDRVAEVASRLEDDLIVNIQGDEPFVSPRGLDHLVSLFRDQAVRVGTLATPFPAVEDPEDPSRVKVVADRLGRALYFSRSRVPSGGGGDSALLLHVGVYAYRREALLDLARLGPCPLERAERLEQLRALWNGISVHLAVGEYGSLGVDTPEDLERARRLWAEHRGAS